MIRRMVPILLLLSLALVAAPAPLSECRTTQLADACRLFSDSCYDFRRKFR